MQPAEARWLIAYDEWANARYLDALAAMDEASLASPLISSFPTLLETMAHIAVAEWVWLRRWKGESPTEAPGWYGQPELRAVRAGFSELQRERADFLESLSADQLSRTLRYRFVSGREGSNTLEHLIQHVVNHSSFHRGQLATMLRQLGGTPPGVDLDDFPAPRAD